MKYVLILASLLFIGCSGAENTTITNVQPIKAVAHPPQQRLPKKLAKAQMRTAGTLEKLTPNVRAVLSHISPGVTWNASTRIHVLRGVKNVGVMVF